MQILNTSSIFQDTPPDRPGLERKRLNNTIQQIIRKAGLELFKAGEHTQQWRVDQVVGTRKKVLGAFAQLGPMGELGDDVVLEVVYHEEVIKALNLIGIMMITKSKVESIVKSDLVMPVSTYLHKKIDVWVPADTFALRNALHDAVSRSSTGLFPFIIILNTRGISYAAVVNKMPTASLRKSGKSPNARKGWYNLLLVNSRNLSKRLFTKSVKSIAAQIPSNIVKKYLPKRTSYNIARSIISVRYR